MKDLTQEFYLPSVIFCVGEKQSGFLESSDGDIKTLVANAVPENTKKDHQLLRGMEIYARVIKLINPFLACWYIG